MESDKQFLERCAASSVHRMIKDDPDYARLFTLALRGAETQWRPIEEAPKGTPQMRVEVLLLDAQGWCHVGYWGTGYCGGRSDTETGQWRIAWDNEPLDDATHFIPLTALGEPTPQPMEKVKG